jgi:hypothetical protein
MTILAGAPEADGSTEISAVEDALADITAIAAPRTRVINDLGGIQAT